MPSYQITATRKDGPDPDYRIDAFKVNGHWYTIQQMIGFIEAGNTFYVSWAGRIVSVFKRLHGRTWRPYLTTEADGYPYNNLLNLPSI